MGGGRFNTSAWVEAPRLRAPRPQCRVVGGRRRGSAVPVSAHTQVNDLSLNDHACLTFGEQEELLDLTAAFARDGLASGCRVVVLSDAPQQALAKLGGHEVAAGSAVEAGQIVIVASADGLIGPGGFSAERAMKWLNGQLADSRRAGYAGMRIALDMSWALQPMTGIEELPVLEEELPPRSAMQSCRCCAGMTGAVRPGHVGLDLAPALSCGGDGDLS
jgi:MEDS: MEthanogen/methylotroph, DcmR Sensory domain